MNVPEGLDNLNMAEELDNLATYLKDARRRLAESDLVGTATYTMESDAVFVTVQDKLDSLVLRLETQRITCYLCKGPRGRIDLLCGDCQRKVPGEDQSNAELDLADGHGWGDGRGQ